MKIRVPQVELGWLPLGARAERSSSCWDCCAEMRSLSPKIPIRTVVSEASPRPKLISSTPSKTRFQSNKLASKVPNEVISSLAGVASEFELRP